MEPVTFAVIVAFLAQQATGQVASEAATDAYRALKDKLSSRFGDKSDVIEAVDILEKRPDSEGSKKLLQEEIDRAAPDSDPEIFAAAQHLRDQIESEPGGEQHIQQARGMYIAQADHGSTANVSVERSTRLPEE
ncbi:MAG: hypothetical protein ACFB50_17135 [Rubrobacteraceae bacterium]